MTSPLHVGRLLRYRLIKCFTKMNPSSQGVKIFACIDHSGEAEKVGLRMHPAQPLIFGTDMSGCCRSFIRLLQFATSSFSLPHCRVAR